MKHQVAAAALAAVFIGLALASAAPYRRGATIGAAIASFTALGSLFAIARSARRAEKQMKGALVVMAVAFLVRMILVALGVVVVARAGESTIAFIVAFFVPYFAFSGIEAAYLHSLRRTPGSTA